MRRRTVLSGLGLLGAAGLPASGDAAPAARVADGPTVPACDHHQHLLSPAAAARNFEAPLAAVELPEPLAALLRAREKAWNDQAALAPLYAEDSLLLHPEEHNWLRGREAVTNLIAHRFARPYRILPVAGALEGASAHIAGFYVRGEGPTLKRIGAVQLAFSAGRDGVWRIAMESPSFPGPPVAEPLDAAALVGLLDEAGIRRAVVLSVAYWFASPLDGPVADEQAKVRAENDWTLAQTAQFPDRLTPFCSVNPLTDYAVAEIARCAADRRFKGLKLHFGNSDVDAKAPDQVARLRTVFAAANAHRLAIVVHLWTDPENYGPADAVSVLNNLLPAAPDVTVQIAHMAGGGPGWTDPALKVYADAVAAGDPRTRNLYFDVATVADRQSWPDLQLLARRIRQIGVKRILYGSDAAFAGRSTPRQEWATFRGTVPLSDAEHRAIAFNVAPYVR